jgi:hypothetical protein
MKNMLHSPKVRQAKPAGETEENKEEAEVF